MFKNVITKSNNNLSIGVVVLLAVLFFCLSVSSSPDKSRTKATDDVDQALMIEKYVLIIKATKDYKEAVNFAIQSSRKLNLKFENGDRKYSREKGIYFSEDIADEIYRGEYYPRRDDGALITLENSGSYNGLKPGYIIIIAGIYSKNEDANEALKETRKTIKDAYIKKTIMWMGCIH